jgi:hypothetical protein
VKARATRCRVWLVATASLVVGALGWAALSRHSTSAVPGARSAGTAPTSSPAQGRGFGGGESAAVATALSDATASQGWLSLDDAGVSAAVARLAAPVAAPGLAAQTVGEMRSVRQALSASPGPVWWVLAPLAVRVEAFHPPSASVDVWVASLLSAPGVVEPTAGFSRVSVGLELVGGTWKLVSIGSSPGPTPMLAPADPPSSAGALGATLAGYAPVPAGDA